PRSCPSSRLCPLARLSVRIPCGRNQPVQHLAASGGMRPRPSLAVVLRRFSQPLGTSLHAFLVRHDARFASERGRARVLTAKPEWVDRLVEIPLALRRRISLVEVAVDPPQILPVRVELRRRVEDSPE